MQIRPGTPDESAPGGQPNQLRYGVPGRVLGTKLATAAVVGLLAALAPTSTQRGVGLLAAAAVALYAVRDIIVRERLRADARGLTVVAGLVRRVHLPWSQIEEVRVDIRPRLGARTELLEIDAGDQLYLLSRFDLGVDPQQAQLELTHLAGA